MRYQFGPFQVDDEAFQLSLEGRPIALEPKAFQLLLHCLRNPGRLLRKQELLDRLWSDANVGENALTRCVAQVRKALSDDTRDPHYIATIPTVGYRFLAEVSVTPLVSNQTSASFTPEIPPSSAALPSGLTSGEQTGARIRARKSPSMLAFIAAGAVLLAGLGWFGWQRYQDHVGGPPVQLVMADLDGGTGDPVLDRTLQDVLRFELLQSPFVSAVSPGVVRNTMTQMRHDPSERLTADLARDVCERTASQAVLHGNLAHLGRRFVLTEEATNCADGATIATAKQQVDNIDDLPAAISRMAAALRHDMGESRRTISRFNRPLSSQNTNSLEALKAFSQATYLSNMGKNTEAVDLLKHAVALDPKFAAAWFKLYGFFDIMDAPERKSYLQKAYDLREFATEPTQLAITAYHEAEFGGDLDAALHNFQTWANVYPRDIQAWQGLADVAEVTDRYPEVIAASKHGLDLDPNNSASLFTLANAQTENGDYDDARKTCELALSKGFDTVLIRRSLLFLGHITQDAALIAQQQQWAETHSPPSPDIVLQQAYFALIEGRATAADALFLRAEEAYRRQGDAALGINYRQGAARSFFELGWPGKARALLNSAPIPTDTYNVPDDLVALAETGKPDLAESLLQKQFADHPQSTRWRRRYAPDLHATIALLAHRPADALAALSGLKGADLDYVAYPLGLAYMDTNRLPQAEGQFRKLVEHPGVDPTSQQHPLAQLQLARVLAREGRKDDAIRQYGVFLQLWKDADKDSSTLRDAQAELSAIHTSGL